MGSDADDVLARRIRDGDATAFEAVFRMRWSALHAFAAALLDDAALAEEVVQSVFTRIWEHRAELRITTSLKAYLYAAVRNAALHRIERRRHEDAWARRVRSEGSELDPAPGAQEGLEREEAERALRGAIAQLPPRRREVLLLRWQHELSYAEIAESLGIGVKAVENHLARALHSLRALLAGRDPQ